MAIGVELYLYDSNVQQSNITGITALWWDQVDVYDFDYPIGKTKEAYTDSNGKTILDLSDISGLTSGEWGYLLLRKENLSNHKNSVVFQGRVQVTTVTGGTKLSYNSGWTRPADWLDLGTLPSSGENKFIALYAVWKGGPNWCAFKFTCSDSSQYTINWGDGSASENVNSDTTAYHSFDYDDLDGDTEIGIAAARSCTFQDTGDTVTLSGHGFDNGTEISFSNVTTTTGISTYTRYWVVGVSGSTFQVAATKGGTALTLTNNGTGAVYMPGYRQALITVVPTTSGKAFTALDTNIRHTSASSVAYRTGFLDVYLNAPSMTTLTLNAPAQNVVHGLMERFQAPELGTVTNFSYMFYSAASLQSIPLLDTSAGTNFSYMFYYAYSLQSIPLLDTSSGTDFSYMFAYAYSLQSIPLLDTGSGTSFSGMFTNASALQNIPLIDTSSGTAFGTMFSGARALQSIPLLDVSSATSFTSMLLNTSSLQRGALKGTAQSITYPAGQLSGAALDEIYTNLATVSGKTITVTGNYGTASDDPSIATAKGWTVVG